MSDRPKPSAESNKFGRVAIFVTCLTDQFYPQVGIAVTRILERFGCSVEFPEAQTCCGQPFFNNGYHGEAAELAKRMVRIFEPYDYVVTPSGSCCAMVREQFPLLLGDDVAWGPGVRRLHDKTFEFVEFLTKVLDVDVSQLALAAPTRVTYHYTCHQRGLGMRSEATDLLKQLKNVEFRDLEKTDQCCGFGGTFAVKYPAISGVMVADKTRCIRETGAEVLVCNDAGCSMNIGGMCHREGMSTRVRHIAELLAEAMGIDIQSF